MSFETVLAFAKLTRTLRVVGVRPSDGFHLIDAEMVTLDFADVLRVRDGGVNDLPPENLVSRALASSSADDGALLVSSLGRADLSPAEIEHLRDVLHRSGAVDEVEALISSLAAPALLGLETSALAEPGRSMLIDLGRAAVYRTA